ncbi:MAG TPA: cation transporter [Candidatus Merdenecus merdavium]|nr:cation transporter [Candidatus Merdenecus merdavium]
MTDFLVRTWIKDYKNTESGTVRTAYGVLASVVGIICNLLLFVVKIIIGIALNSISVMADAFNNLSDAASCVISFVGVKLADRPADKEHPFGHGRIEYISALMVSFLIIEVGFTFLKDGIKKIQSPETISFRLISIIFLFLSIGVKLWMAFFNKKLGMKIQSKVMSATAADAIGDVVATSATIFGLVVFQLSGKNMDGYIGILVAIFVMWSGIGIAKDTLEPLIGESIDPELYKRVTDLVESYDGIVGSHDLIIHNYGPNKSMGSIHAEVPSDVDINVSHEIIDKIERDAHKKIGILLVIHMDPIETKDKKILNTKNFVEQIIEQVDPELSFHDFRMVDGVQQVNLIFDLVVPFNYDEGKEEKVSNQIKRAMKEIDPKYECVITFDRPYVEEEE